MTVNCYLWAAPGFIEQLNRVIKLSPAAGLPRSACWGWACTFSFCSKYWYTNLHSAWVLLAWPPLPVVLHNNYLKILGCIFSSWISCWCLSRMGKVKPHVLLCPGCRNFPSQEQGQQDFPFPPWSVGGQGSKPGDEWHEVTHAPNPKHLTLENWLQF